MPFDNSKALRWKILWGGLFGCLGGLDVWRMTKGDDSTLSATIRTVFRTDTPEGKALFCFALAVLAVHILHP